MSITIYRSRKGITAYCARCRVKWHSDNPNYEPNEQALLGFESDHAHGTADRSVRSGRMPDIHPNSFLSPSPKLCAALGSIVVHADELLSSDCHTFDRIALRQLLDDPDVRAWILCGRALAMVPETRS